MRLRALQREKQRVKDKNRMTSLADQVKRGAVRKKQAAVHVTRKD